MTGFKKNEIASSFEDQQIKKGVSISEKEMGYYHVKISDEMIFAEAFPVLELMDSLPHINVYPVFKNILVPDTFRVKARELLNDHNFFYVIHPLKFGRSFRFSSIDNAISSFILFKDDQVPMKFTLF